MYALGALAHFLLTGRPPFDAPSATAVIAMQLGSPAPRLAEVARGVPGRLAAAVDRCLAKDPAHRFATAEAFAEALADVGQKRAVAAPLRAWASGGGWVDPGLFLIGGVSFVSIMMMQEFWPLAAPAAYALMQRLRLTRSVLAQGYDANDLAAAIVAEMDRHAEESAAHFSARPSRWVRALRWTAGGFAVGSIGIAIWAERILARLNTVNVATGGEIVVRLGGAAVVAGIAAIVTGLVAEATSPSRILDRLGGSDFAWRLRFWRSRRGEMLARWLKRGTRPVSRADADRPTEVIVGSAVASLYEALPRQLRRELAGLPDVVAQLEGRARALREHRARMEDLASVAAAPLRVKGDDSIERRQHEAVDDLESARQAVDRQLAATVTALETLRIDLLRLHAGSGSTPDLTAALGAAARIGDEVSTNLDTRASVEKLLHPDHALSP